jgi:hypothetical protein
MNDWRIDGVRLLDKTFAMYPHLRSTINPAGDYELRCSKCGEVETYLGAGDKEIDVLTFALHVSGKHKHDTPDELHPTFKQFLDDALDPKRPPSERRKLIDREIKMTEEANEGFRKREDIPGLRFGEKYLILLRKVDPSDKLHE